MVTKASCPMCNERRGYCPKPLEHVATFLSKKWTISILITIGNFGKLRFNEIKNKIGGISAKVLSERLEELEKRDFVERRVYHEKPPRVEYKLTSRGKMFYRKLVPLTKLG